MDIETQVATLEELETIDKQAIESVKQQKRKLGLNIKNQLRMSGMN